VSAPYWLGRFDSTEQQRELWRLSVARAWENDVQREAMVALWQVDDIPKHPELMPEIGYAHAARAIKRFTELIWVQLHELSELHQRRARKAIGELVLSVAEQAGLMAAPRRRGAPRLMPTTEHLRKLRGQGTWLVNQIDEWRKDAEVFAQRHELTPDAAWTIRYPLLTTAERSGLLDPKIYGRWDERRYSRADWLIGKRLTLSAERVHRAAAPRQLHTA